MTFCKFLDCAKNAIYNYVGLKAKFCKDHKEDGMIDVKHKKCEHNKQKTKCKECTPTAYCSHGKLKERCKLCGGSAFCEHGKRKDNCIECDGNSICEHKKQKRNCKDCGGSAICEHGKYKNICIECGGSSLCIHNKQKRYCKECDGSAFCEHGKYKIYCSECDGASLCIHSKVKHYCKECDGSAFCEHGKYKDKCQQCGTGLCQSEACSIYDNTERPLAQHLVNGLKLCRNCYNHLVPGDAKPKTLVRKEQFVLAEIQRQLPELEDFFVLWDCPIDGGCSNKRPDMLYDFGIGCLVIEIDEDAHKSEDPSCREKRMCEIFLDLGERPLIFIRFNPDRYGTREPIFRMTLKTHQLRCNETEFEYRMEKLVEEIKKVYKTYVIDQHIPKLFDVVNLFM
jgi:hypothetical protein